MGSLSAKRGGSAEDGKGSYGKKLCGVLVQLAAAVNDGNLRGTVDSF